MSVKQIVKKLSDEIKEKNRKEVIESCEELLTENFEEISSQANFFNLPLNNIFSVISKVDFNEIEENDKIIEFITNIIKNIINKHFEEKETILILQNLNITTISFSYEEIFSLLELITNCPILVNFCYLYKEQKQLVDKDYEYEIQQKDEEIEKLKQKLPKEFPPITEKPKDYEPDIFKSCKEGKLSSVQWLLEKENEDKNQKVEEYNEELEFYKDDTPIHIASKNGHLPIVQYLIEKQNVDIDIKGNERKTPLLYAFEKVQFDIVEYLIAKGANIEAKDEHFEQAPLHYACEWGYLPIVEYLISEGANIQVTDRVGHYSIHYACQRGHLLIVDYLL